MIKFDKQCLAVLEIKAEVGNNTNVELDTLMKQEKQLYCRHHQFSVPTFGEFPPKWGILGVCGEKVGNSYIWEFWGNLRT